MTEDWLIALASSPFALPLLFSLVLGDAFLVLVPGEAAVTAFGALAVSAGVPPLTAVVAVAAVAAACGDACCYLAGRVVGLHRWRWMRTRKAQRAFAWADARLWERTALVLFTARFIPFARLAVNLVAGASRLPAPRYLAVASGAALAWALYQALLGALVAAILPGGAGAAVVLSVLVAVGVGLMLDAVLARAGRGRAHRLQVVTRERRDVAAAGQYGGMTEPSDDWTGYDAGFLGIPVPLPTPLGDTAVRELRYPRFTVLLEPVRRLALATGVNIDGAQLLDLERRGEWDLDPRVPVAEQVGPAVYAKNDLDRGHLVRRRDPGWGTVAEAAEATAATFFYTNAAPQAAGFNQSKELWLGLEDHILAYAETTDQRISVFTAPVLEPDDPPYRGIRVPRRFWKVAAWSPARGRLASAGFILDQTELIDVIEPAIPPLGAFRTFQVPVGEIEHLAGVDLGALADSDVFTTPTARPPAWKPLDAPSDIVLG